MRLSYLRAAHTLSGEAADGWLVTEVVSDDVTSPTVETEETVESGFTFLSSELLTVATPADNKRKKQ